MSSLVSTALIFIAGNSIIFREIKLTLLTLNWSSYLLAADSKHMKERKNYNHKVTSLIIMVTLVRKYVLDCKCTVLSVHMNIEFPKL